MNVTVLVIAKEAFKSKGKDFFKVGLVIIACSEMRVLVGKSISKLVESDFYNLVEVDPTTAIDLEIDLKEAFKPEYANLHLEVDILGFAEPEEIEPVPEQSEPKPDTPAEPVKVSGNDKKTGGKEEKA